MLPILIHNNLGLTLSLILWISVSSISTLYQHHPSPWMKGTDAGVTAWSRWLVIT